MTIGTEVDATPVKDSTSRDIGAVRQAAASLIAVAAALVVGAAILIWAHANPLAAYVSMAQAAFGSAFGFGQMLIELCPLLIIGLGLAIAFQGRIWNIGAEGQFYVGALTGGLTAIYCPVQIPVVVIPIAIVAGAVGGALWGAIAGLLRVTRGVNEIISSLLLTYIAELWFQWAVRRPFHDPAAYYPQSRPIPSYARLPELPAVGANIGVLIALALVPLFWYIMKYTPFGFRTRALGLGRETAELGGVRISRYVMMIMALSGALAGLAGVIQVLGVQFVLQNGLSPGFGYTAIIVALLGRNKPLGVLVAATFIATLEFGGVALQTGQGVPTAAVDTIVALFIVFSLIAYRAAGRT